MSSKRNCEKKNHYDRRTLDDVYRTLVKSGMGTSGALDGGVGCDDTVNTVAVKRSCLTDSRVS